MTRFNSVEEEKEYKYWLSVARMHAWAAERRTGCERAHHAANKQIAKNICSTLLDPSVTFVSRVHDEITLQYNPPTPNRTTATTRAGNLST